MIHSINIDKRRAQTRRFIASMIGQRVYLVFASELGLQCHGKLAGMTAVGLSALVRESLPDEYFGPSPAICIQDDHLRDGTYSPEGSAMLFDAIVLHELSHVVQSGITFEACPESDGEQLRQLVQMPWTDWKAHTGAAKWIGHDCRFIRTLCHVHHRMKSRGHCVSLNLAFSHTLYGLSSAEEYAAALGDECSAMSWLPLSEALARPMPAKFQKLWVADVLQSLKNCPVLKGLFNVEVHGKTGLKKDRSGKKKSVRLGTTGL